MKQIIRRNTFETNSSSTHSLIICTDEEYDALNNGLLYIAKYGNIDEFYTKEELEEKYEKDIKWKSQANYDSFEQWCYDNDYCTLDNWYDDLEYDETSYITKSGDKINIICKFGFDG